MIKLIQAQLLAIYAVILFAVCVGAILKIIELWTK